MIPQEGEVWLSRFMQNHDIGVAMKVGLRVKFPGEEWDPPQHKRERLSERILRAVQNYAVAVPLPAEMMPKSAVFDEYYFERAANLFVQQGIYIARPPLADILARFGLGEGGLFPYTIYEPDLVTPRPEKFFLINLGARKDCLLPEECRPKSIRKLGNNRITGRPFWGHRYPEHDDFAVSSEALEGPDLWHNPGLSSCMFMSGALARAIALADLGVDFKFSRCRIVQKESAR